MTEPVNTCRYCNREIPPGRVYCSHACHMEHRRESGRSKAHRLLGTSRKRRLDDHTCVDACYWWCARIAQNEQRRRGELPDEAMPLGRIA